MELQQIKTQIKALEQKWERLDDRLSWLEFRESDGVDCGMERDKIESQIEQIVKSLESLYVEIDG
jgi:prefoldin subunit 5